MSEAKRPAVVMVAAIGSLVMALCCGGMWGGLAPAMFEVHKKMMTSMTDRIKAQVERQKAEIRQKRAATGDAQQIAALDQQMAALDRNVPPDISGLYEGFLAPQVKGCYLFEGISSLVLYLLIFIAGCGMFAMAPWARTLGLIAAAGRIVTAVAYAFLNALVILPAMAMGFKKMMDAITQMQSAAGQPMPAPPDMSKLLAIQGGVGVVFFLLLSVAWPVAMLILLNTRSAKEAFSSQAAAPDAGLQPQP